MNRKKSYFEKLMRTLLKFILFLILIFCGSCNKEVILTEGLLPDEIFYPEGSSTPFNGKCLVYFKNSRQIHYIFNYKKGILEGSFMIYHKNGQVEFKGNYTSGELTGELLKYYDNGSLNSKYTITN